MRTSNKYEPAPEYTHDAYTLAGWGAGIAWAVYGWETEPDVDTEWSGYEVRTGNLVACMIGDNTNFSVDPSEVTPLDEGTYCHSCGQVGCSHG